MYNQEFRPLTEFWFEDQGVPKKDRSVYLFIIKGIGTRNLSSRRTNPTKMTPTRYLVSLRAAFRLQTSNGANVRRFTLSNQRMSRQYMTGHPPNQCHLQMWLFSVINQLLSHKVEVVLSSTKYSNIKLHVSEQPLTLSYQTLLDKCEVHEKNTGDNNNSRLS